MPTDPRSDAAVRRLYGALRQSLRSRGGSTTDEVTVSEIYQTLVPYARARSELGFEMNADYEHALMRMLAGEGGFARLDQPEAHAQVAREISSSHPDVTLYRRFAACTVKLTGGTAAEESVAVSVSAAPSSSAVSAAPSSSTVGPAPSSSAVAPASPSAREVPSVADTEEPPASARAAGAEDAQLARGAPGGPDPDATWGEALQRIQAGAPAARADTQPGGAKGEAVGADAAKMRPGAAGMDADAVETPADATVSSPAAPAGRSAANEESAVLGATQGSPATPPEAHDFDSDPSGGVADENDDTAAPARGRPQACGSCGQDLPSDRDARFCPYCGSEQPLECAACGDDLREDWRYCPSCGTAA